MNRLTRTFLVLALVTTLVPAPLIAADSDVATQQELQREYIGASTGGDKVRVLVMPGHEPTYGGAEYQGFYEREIVVEVADQLAAYLKQNPEYEVIVARSNTEWHEDLAEYFDDEWRDIEKFVSKAKRDFNRSVRRGDISLPNEEETVSHNSAPSEVALRLYGISKWANENDIDLVLHLHVNDTTDHSPDEPSKHSGFTMYVPDSQYGNGEVSRDLAEALAPRFSAMQATSTLPVEDKGIVPSQELIAIGAFDTLEIPSVLIEYGYITEPKFTAPEVRSTVTKDLAYQTYLGVQDFFADPVNPRFPTVTLPTAFTETPKVGSSSPEAYALQAALHTLGFYPAATTTRAAASSTATTTMRTFSECPISGLMNDCTVDAISAFQKSKGWSPTGALGPMTRAELNRLFGTGLAATTIPDTTPMPVASTTTASVTATCSLTKQLVLNSTDAETNGEVTMLQKILAKDTSLYPEGLVTGFFGPATEKAVKVFQVKNGVVQEGGAGYGKVGPKTREVLGKVCGV